MRFRLGYVGIAFAGVAACLFPDPSPLGGDDGGADAIANDVTSDVTPVDAGGDGDADAGPVCDPSKPFDSIKRLDELEIDDQYKETLTPDELDIWFGETLHSDAGNTSEIMHATRDASTSTFGTPSVESSIAPGDVDPAISDDGLTLYFSKFGTVGSWDLFETVRSDRKSPFSLGVQLPGAIQSSSSDTAAFVAFDQSLYFASARAGTNDIWRAPAQDGGFGAPAPVTSLSSGGNDEGVVLTHDGLWAYVTSDRTDLGSAGSFDIYLAHRATTSDDFGALVNQTELNGSSAERANWISWDGCRLYFESTRNRPSGASLYVATKIP